MSKSPYNLVLTYLGRTSNWDWGQDIVPTAVESMASPYGAGRPMYGYEFRHWINPEEDAWMISISNIGELPLWVSSVLLLSPSMGSSGWNKKEIASYSYGNYFKQGYGDLDYFPFEHTSPDLISYPVDKDQQQKFAILPLHTSIWNTPYRQNTESEFFGLVQPKIDNLPSKIHVIGARP